MRVRDMTEAAPMDLHRLLRPRSIAVAGASPDPATLGGAVLKNIRDSGFAGELHLVSPTRPEINGQKSLPTLADLPMGVDVAVLNVPATAVRETVEQCIARGVGGAVVFASGFGEAGEAGRREQAKIAHLCSEAGFALLGPNCLGFTNLADGIALTFEALEFQRIESERPLAIVAQSGATAANIRSAVLSRGVPVSQVVATGNEAVLRFDHFIRYFLEEGCAAIAAYVEQIRDPQAFLEAAHLARTKGVPIIMVHPGSSARGAAAAASHTGAMAGEYPVMKASVKAAGVVLVDTMDELFDAAAILYRFPKPVHTGNGTAILTNSGAIRGLSLDFCETVGLKIAELTAADKAELQKLVPPTVEADNPFDFGPAGFSDNSIFANSTRLMLANPAVGSVLLPMTGGGPRQQRAKADAIVPVAREATKPVVVAIVGDELPLDPGLVQAMRESETPFFRSPERALRALAAVHTYAEALADLEDVVTAPPSIPDLPGRGVLPEYAGKQFLRALGVAVPDGALVQTVDEASAAAKRIGYPVVIKAQASAVAHKSDVGGVVVNLKDEAELKAGWDRMHASLARAGVGKLDAVLVEQMSKPGLELMIGGRNDPQWGPMIVFGLGGVWVEALDAVEVLPANAGGKQILRRLANMRGAKLLGPFRGKPARDVGAVADVIQKLGAALRARPDLIEVDINPLVVFADGEGAMALDALFVLSES